tara:strand:+ start:652 stop:1008 length:357 start_codon:yes stop_codon:yes gene_type:complete
MKNKAFILFSLFPICLLQACGGGSLVLKTTTGSEIEIKKEDVSCVTKNNPMFEVLKLIECRSNGIKTDITGRTFPFTETKTCVRQMFDMDYNPAEFKVDNQNSFACSAANHYGMYEKP